MTPHFNYYPNNMSISKVTNFENIMSNYFKETPIWDSDHDRRLFDQGENEEWPRKKRNEEDEDYDEDQDEDFITL